jgi:hypothetical protein
VTSLVSVVVVRVTRLGAVCAGVPSVGGGGSGCVVGVDVSAEVSTPVDINCCAAPFLVGFTMGVVILTFPLAKSTHSIPLPIFTTARFKCEVSPFIISQPSTTLYIVPGCTDTSLITNASSR